MESHIFASPFGSYSLKPRYFHPRSPLRAWNAADELLLSEAQAQLANHQDANVLILNDQEGALTVNLHRWHPTLWTDYISTELSTLNNLRRNQLPDDSVTFIPSTSIPDQHYDLVLMQLPKTLSLLHWQLYYLREILRPGTAIIAGGMIKHMPKSMISAFDTFIGATHTSLARKKARLIHSEFDPARTSAAPKSVNYKIPNTDLHLINFANVFSQSSLDIGTRFFLEHFPDVSSAKHVVDLGCGNGALGIYACSQNTDLNIHFLDHSYLALKSAQASFNRNKLVNGADFIASDGLAALAEKVDMILCNPPFHEGAKVHTQIADRMFREAADRLHRHGTLVVIGNRHLGYHVSLKRFFTQVNVRASHQKFVIFEARNDS